MVTWLF